MKRDVRGEMEVDFELPTTRRGKPREIGVHLAFWTESGRGWWLVDGKVWTEEGVRLSAREKRQAIRMARALLPRLAWPEGERRAPHASAGTAPEEPMPGEHHWLTPEEWQARWPASSASRWTVCLWCSAIKRDGKNRPCPGKVEIELRDEPHAHPRTLTPAQLLDADPLLLDLTVRASNGIQMAGIKTVRELVGMTRAKVAALKNMGEQAADDVAAVLAGFGLAFKEEPEEPVAEAPREIDVTHLRRDAPDGARIILEGWWYERHGSKWTREEPFKAPDLARLADTAIEVARLLAQAGDPICAREGCGDPLSEHPDGGAPTPDALARQGEAAIREAETLAAAAPAVRVVASGAAVVDEQGPGDVEDWSAPPTLPLPAEDPLCARDGCGHPMSEHHGGARAVGQRSFCLHWVSVRPGFLHRADNCCPCPGFVAPGAISNTKGDEG